MVWFMHLFKNSCQPNLTYYCIYFNPRLVAIHPTPYVYCHRLPRNLMQELTTNVHWAVFLSSLKSAKDPKSCAKKWDKCFRFVEICILLTTDMEYFLFGGGESSVFDSSMQVWTYWSTLALSVMACGHKCLVTTLGSVIAGNNRVRWNV